MGMTDQTPDERRAKRAVGDAEVSEEIADDFKERQQLAEGGRPALKRYLREAKDTIMKSPELSGGDVDADWHAASNEGAEAFTGHAPTPDQDVVDELGAAAGITYRDDEPLNYAKVAERDRRRWELDPASADDTDAPGNTLDEDDQFDLGLDDEDEDELFSHVADPDAEDDLAVEAALDRDEDEMLEDVLDGEPDEDGPADDDDEMDEDDEVEDEDDEDED